MKSAVVLSSVSLLLLLALSGASCRRVSPSVSLLSSAAGEQREFLPGQPRETVKAPGGSVRVWSEDFKELQDADLGAAFITVEPQSLALPKYTDAPQVLYVLEGEARAGLITPIGLRTNLRHLRHGDALAIPRGWASWVWNNNDKPFRAVGVADTSHGPQTGRYTAFHLVGGQKEGIGGVLHGFSKELLSRAWAVDPKDVERLLEGQKDSAFVKVQQPQAQQLEAWLGGMGEEEEREGGANMLGWEVAYNLIERGPDIYSKRGGRVTAVSGWKLPIFKKIGLGAARVHLEGNAMVAPHWVANAANLHFITRGSGRIEITYPDGRQALQHDVKEGDVVVIPTGFPHATIAGEQGITYVSFVNNRRPMAGFLAGANSVFKALPKKISAAAFNVDEQFLDKFRKQRLEDFVILPAPGQGGEESDGVSDSWQDVMAAQLDEEMLNDNLESVIGEGNMAIAF